MKVSLLGFFAALVFSCTGIVSAGPLVHQFWGENSDHHSETSSVRPAAAADIVSIAMEDEGMMIEEVPGAAPGDVAYDANLCCESVWRTRTGPIFMTRTGNDEVPIFGLGIGGPVILDAGDYGYDWAVGLDVAVARRLDACHELEFRYMGLQEVTGSATAVSPGAVIIALQFPFIVVVPPQAVTASHSSEFQSGEINIRRQATDRISWIGGFRWFELKEDLNIATIVAGLIDTNLNNHTSNQLFGAQLGADVQFWELNSPFSITGTAKAGLFANVADHDLGISVLNIPVAAASDSDTSAAFVGELQLNLGYQLTNTIRLRGGYQLMWIDGVAVASEQLPVTNVIAGNGIHTGGDVFYHGANVGLDVIW